MNCYWDFVFCLVPSAVACGAGALYKGGMGMTAKTPLIYCAADTVDLEKARVLATVLRQEGCGLKLGLEFFSAQGPEGVRVLRSEFPDLPLFLNLKFHDIPNTVAQAVRAVVPLGVDYVNIHAAGGAAMMRAAAEAAMNESVKRGMKTPQVLAVTVLTSLDRAALEEVGQPGDAAGQAERLALLARSSGVAGVVCSAHEITRLRAACGSDFILMVPGIRPAGADTQDQKRTMTPAEAMTAGATHLVIGRPITQAPDPAAAIRAILAGMG